jgi:hypothetical protein
MTHMESIERAFDLAGVKYTKTQVEDTGGNLKWLWKRKVKNER